MVGISLCIDIFFIRIIQARYTTRYKLTLRKLCGFVIVTSHMATIGVNHRPTNHRTFTRIIRMKFICEISLPSVGTGTTR